MNKYLLKCIGTFILVFSGTGAIVINDISGGVVSQVGIGLTFGFVVMAMIYSIGAVSGVHINPVVSLAFWTEKNFQEKIL